MKINGLIIDRRLALPYRFMQCLKSVKQTHLCQSVLKIFLKNMQTRSARFREDPGNKLLLKVQGGGPLLLY